MRRNVDIGSYLPPVTGEKKEFKAIAETESQELTAVWTDVDSVHQNQYLFDSDEYGIRRREKALRIQPLAGDTLDIRKFRIYTLLNNRLPYTWLLLLEYLTQLCGEGLFLAEMNAALYSLVVETDARIQSKTPIIAEMLRKMLPTNLTLDLRCRIKAPPGALRIGASQRWGQTLTVYPYQPEPIVGTPATASIGISSIVGQFLSVQPKEEV